MSKASAELEQALQLDNEAKMATRRAMDLGIDFLVTLDPQIEELQSKLTAAEEHNKKLKNLSIYHLDLIQKQHELMTKREKVFQALKHENARLRSKLNRIARKASLNQGQSTNASQQLEEALFDSVENNSNSPSMDVGPSSSATTEEYSAPQMNATSSSAVSREDSLATMGAACSCAAVEEDFALPIDVGPSASEVKEEDSSLPIDEAASSEVENEYSPPPMDVAYSLFAVEKKEADSTPQGYGL